MGKREDDLQGRTRRSPADVPKSVDWVVDPPLERSARRALSKRMEELRIRLLEKALQVAEGNVPLDEHCIERAYAILFPEEPAEDWSTANRRRVHLIRNEITGDISAAERAELAELQVRADRRMSETVPRQMEFLEELEAMLGISDVDESTDNDSEK